MARKVLAGAAWPTLKATRSAASARRPPRIDRGSEMAMTARAIRANAFVGMFISPAFFYTRDGTQFKKLRQTGRPGHEFRKTRTVTAMGRSCSYFAPGRAAKRRWWD